MSEKCVLCGADIPEGRQVCPMCKWKEEQMGDNRWAVYERLKAEIARTAKSAEEYERRIKALARRLNL